MLVWLGLVLMEANDDRLAEDLKVDWLYEA